MTWYVGNAKQAASYYIARMGFKSLAYSGLETGSRCTASHVITNGGAVFVLKAPIRPIDFSGDDLSCDEQHELNELHQHVSKHGDAVKDIAFEVDDVQAVYDKAVANGALSVKIPTTVYEEGNDHITTAVVRTYGDTTHTLIDKSHYSGLFMPGYRPAQSVDPIERYLPPVTFVRIDHCVGNQDWDELEDACEL